MAHQFMQRRRTAHRFRQHRIHRRQHQLARRLFGGRAFHHGQQHLDFLVPTARILQVIGQRGIEDVRGVALAYFRRELCRQLAELIGVGLGNNPLR